MANDMPLAVRSVTLDLDGTMVDTLPDLSAAANAMLRELDLPQRDENEIRGFVGRGMDHLISRCIGDQSPALRSHATQIFRRHYVKFNGRAAHLYPGVIEGLDALRRMHLPLAVVTNKPTLFTGPLLDATALAPYFRFAVCGDSLPEKKPHPLPLLYACERLAVAPHENLHIGDSQNDVRAARAAGCPVYCVPYGYSEGEDVRRIDCDAIVMTLDDAARRIIPATDVCV